MQVPEGWEVIPLIKLIDGDIRNGYSPVAHDTCTGYWVLGLGALGENGINALEIKPVLLEERVVNSLLKKDDFLVSRSNTPDKVGRSIRFQGEVENCSYPDLMMRFRINEKKADKSFIEQQLKSSRIKGYFQSCAAGSSSTMVKINKSVLEKTPIAKPSLQEQQKIAQILSTWDKAITTTEQLLTNSQQQKKALMQQLLTGKKRLLDDNGQRFSGEWAVSALAELSTVTKGKQINRDTLSDSGDYAVINGGIEPSGYTSSFNTLANTITISEGGNSCGYVAYQERNFWCGGHCYAVTRPSISNEFIYQALKHCEFKIMSLRVGSGLPNIQKKAIDGFKIKYPENKEEQQKIATVLTAADNEITQLQQKLDQLKQEKKALMQQLLTGKRRVKVEEVA